MSKHKLDREEIMSFLLGELEEAETSRIESIFLSDPTYSEAIEKAKSQLYEEYKSGRLSPAQSGRFEKRLLPDLDEDKKKFQAMLDRNEALRKGGGDAGGGADADSDAESSAATSPKAVASAPSASSSSKSNAVVTRLLVVAVLAVGAAAAVVFMKGSSEEVAAATVSLPMFSVQGQSQLIVLPPGARVELHLALPSDTPSKNFAVTAYNSGAASQWSATRVGDVVHVEVERKSLADGRYDLELRTNDAAEAAVVGYYSFQK